MRKLILSFGLLVGLLFGSNVNAGSWFFVPTNGSSLLSGLVSYWNLNQGSASTRTDSVGSNNLTVINGTVSSVAGLINNCISIADGAIDTSLSRAAINPAGSFSFVFWTNPTTVNSASTNITIMGQQLTHLSYWLVQRDSGYRIKMSPDDSNVFEAIDGTTISTGNWYMIYFHYDDTAHQIAISVNNDSLTTTSMTGPVFATTDDFTVGSNAPGRPATGLQGKLDEMGYWSRILTSDERTALYNSGSGITYPF